MVFFTCCGCNESLKKVAVDKHASSCHQCYAVTCIDCSVTFEGDDYRQHTTCISEAEKYEKSLYKGKSKANAAKQNPQDAWMELVADAAAAAASASPAIRAPLARMSELGNVPRQEKKFINFVKNSLNLRNDRVVAEIWSHLAALREERRSKADDAAPGAAVMAAAGLPEVNGGSAAAAFDAAAEDGAAAPNDESAAAADGAAAGNGVPNGAAAAAAAAAAANGGGAAATNGIKKRSEKRHRSVDESSTATMVAEQESGAHGNGAGAEEGNGAVETKKGKKRQRKEAAAAVAAAAVAEEERSGADGELLVAKAVKRVLKNSLEKAVPLKRVHRLVFNALLASGAVGATDAPRVKTAVKALFNGVALPPRVTVVDKVVRYG